MSQPTSHIPHYLSNHIPYALIAVVTRLQRICNDDIRNDDIAAKWLASRNDEVDDDDDDDDTILHMPYFH